MISRRKIIFVGGIHGVGKSTVCKKLCDDIGGIYLSASKLIGAYRNKLLLKNIDNGKLVADIDKNQDFLVKAVAENIEQDRKYLLDGHFTLLDSSGTIQTIPLSTFAGLMLTAAIVLTDDPVLIQKRLLLRDGAQYDLKLLESMQIQELSHAEHVSLNLKIKFYEISTGNYDHMRQIAMDLFGVMHK